MGKGVEGGPGDVSRDVWGGGSKIYRCPDCFFFSFENVTGPEKSL